MQRFAILLWSIVVIVIATLHCSRADKQIVDVKLCESLKEKGCVTDSPLFSISTPIIFCSFIIDSSTGAKNLKVSWYYLGDSRVLIEETSLECGQGKSIKMHSSLNKPLNGWPIGIYELEISLLNETKISVIKSFSIK